ncbi:MAG: sensor histidine kinase [Bacteroidota bacterium]|jgi:hypothetical protein
MGIKTESGPQLFDKRDLIIRHIIIALMAIFYGAIGHINDPVEELRLHIFTTFLYIVIIWNGNILLLNLLDKRISLEKQLRAKLLISGSIALTWPIAVHYLFYLLLFPLIHGHQCDLKSKENIANMVTSVIITLLINSIFVANAFFRQWKRTLQEKEELKRTSLSAEFETLKSQINPHFLFNSLNTLTTLIEENPATATNFIHKLSDVYRYVLNQKEKETVTLGEELEFIQAYVYLNQIRFGNNLCVHIHVPAECRNKSIATLSLQMLLENAIKHNVISAKHPLQINISANGSELHIRNNLQRKMNVESNGIGLNNIITRYGYLTKSQVEITETEDYFMVILPLI